MIVQVWQPIDHPTCPGMSNLQIFVDGPNDADVGTWTGSVLFDPAGAPGTWHWPVLGMAATAPIGHSAGAT
jgi:hypothetical protein